MELDALSVGRKYAPAKLRSEGAYLAIDTSGVMLWLNYSNPTSKEIREWTKPGKLDVRFTTLNDVFFLLVKAEGQPWIDAPFCPQISEQYYLPEIKDDSKGYSMTIMMTDENTAIIKGLRVVGLSNSFSRSLKTELDRINQIPINISKYDLQRHKIIAMYSSADLAAHATCKNNTN